MKKKYKWIAIGLLIAFTLGITGISQAMGKKEETKEVVSIGSAKAATDKNYTLEEMLTYAIQDEYMAQAEYDAIMDKFGVQKPFSNIIKAEGKHIDMLLPLLKTYDVTVPKNDAADRIKVPENLKKSYTAGIEAEKKNIAMYESFLKEDLPDDVKVVMERLLEGSKKHLAAFERGKDGKKSMGIGNNDWNGMGKKHSGNNEKGRGMGNSSTEDCQME